MRDVMRKHPWCRAAPSTPARTTSAAASCSTRPRFAAGRPCAAGRRVCRCRRRELGYRPELGAVAPTYRKPGPLQTRIPPKRAACIRAGPGDPTLVDRCPRLRPRSLARSIGSRLSLSIGRTATPRPPRADVHENLVSHAKFPFGCARAAPLMRPSGAAGGSAAAT